MRVLIVIAGALLVFSASSASAVCTQAKMQEIWHYHAINATHDTQGVSAFTFVEKCQFRVNSEGIIIEDSCADDDGSFFETFTFNVDPSCAVQLEIDFPCRFDGQFLQNQKLATGIGLCAGAAETADPLYFSLVKGKRPPTG